MVEVREYCGRGWSAAPDCAQWSAAVVSANIDQEVGPA
jgi:hypothetical protein